MPLLSVEDLKVHHATPAGAVRAVDGVTLHIDKGETVGLVGESGCGKSTLAKAVLRLVPVTGGRIRVGDSDITDCSDAALRPYRRQLQMVFQDPLASLNPRQTIGAILEAPLRVHGARSRQDRQRSVAQMLGKVGLPPGVTGRYPHEFSGGQRQRIGIARALILRPSLVICDEAVSALDLSIQAQILNLLRDMKREFGLSYLFISHDLSVVHYFTDRTLVMYLGKIVESAPSQTLRSAARHPYTQALLDAVPDPAKGRRIQVLPGDLPSAANVQPGCRFQPRCPLATDLCRREEPLLRANQGSAHMIACHHAA